MSATIGCDGGSQEENVRSLANAPDDSTDIKRKILIMIKATLHFFMEHPPKIIMMFINRDGQKRMAAPITAYKIKVVLNGSAVLQCHPAYVITPCEVK